MRRTCLFDLETITDPSVIDILPEPEPDSRLVNKDKIAADIEKKVQKQIDMLGVDPKTNLICCASFADFEEKKTTSFTLEPLEKGSVLTLGDKEAILLRDIWEHMKPYNRFVTFNGNSFDVECLNFHSAIRGVEIAIRLSQNNYRPVNHYDLRMVFARGNSRAKGKFDFFAKRFGATGKDGLDGSMVQGMWDAGEIEDIKKYCESDVRNLYHVYKRLIDTKYIS